MCDDTKECSRAAMDSLSSDNVEWLNWHHKWKYNIWKRFEKFAFTTSEKVQQIKNT